MIGLVCELVVRAGVGGLLVLAGYAKAATSMAWRLEWLDSYELLPRPLLAPVAWLLPVTELAVGTMYVLGVFGRAGAAAAAIVLAVVSAAVVIALLRGQQVSCGCLGKVGTLISWPVVARNAVLIAAVAATAVRGLHGPTLTGPAPAVQATVVAAVVAVLSVWAHRRRPTEPVHDPSAHPHPPAAGEPADLPFPQPPTVQEIRS
ncbi:MauE/DoxX family redox-associated membrane protein [Nocardia fusca]|uniref:MauE/DoxX family redox-associated membrane protein n=1 Tax=Nocardia fusca TaxID=941183 RepID=A0ABV3FKE7_9NOCA